VKPKKARGIAAVEAPRGILFHDYTFDEKGFLEKANIVTPTAQNLRNMEEDIKAYLELLLKEEKPKDEIVLEIEKLIRAYDPCFSCSTHFLDVTWKET
jgi:coenzyme F420-reducing hydrogenase alpha subunit